jgi:predicted nucleotidyltransferase
MDVNVSAIIERKQRLEKELWRIVPILIKKYRPEKIILFGSLIRGKMHEWSDIDLLIIKKTSEKPLDRAASIMEMLNYPGLAIDIFVYTPWEIEYLFKEGSQFIVEALEQGKILYEKGG